MTDAQLYQQAKRIFLSATELSGDKRTAYIRDAVKNNEPLESLVNQLIAGDEDSGSGVAAILEDGAIRALADDGSGLPSSFADILESEPPQHPKRIGKYDIVRFIAEGGMGTVYEATTQNPTRHVALKIVRASNMTAAARRRFQFEIEILAKLEHPGIGRLYDAGTADTDRGPLPFLAMEFIDGVDLLTYADKHSFSPRQRLTLFAFVADAVHYAHQKGVIHRDLKPSNILVESVSGQPKILDFGVARVMDDDIERATMTSDVGQLIGTLSYMSPEQLNTDAGGVDTRTDVYALGVIMYELLAGKPPFDIRGKSVVDAGRIIRDTDAPKVGTISRSLAGDIETIVTKALEKDRDRRYQSAADLAADIRRFLNNEPITARPQTVIYSLTRFAKRHTGLVAGVAIAAIALVAGTIVATSLAISESKQRVIAEKESAKSEAVVVFLQDMFAALNPEKSTDTDISVREFLDLSAEQALDESTIPEPSIRAAVLHVLGNAYIELGYDVKAEPLLSEALDIVKRDEPPNVPALGESLRLLSRSYARQSRLEEAEKLAERAVVLYREHYGLQDDLTALAINDLAIIVDNKGDLERAEQLYRESLQIREAIGEPRAIATSLSNVGDILHNAGRVKESLEYHQRALDFRRKHLRPDHPRLATTLNNIAPILQDMGRFDEAREMFEEALAIREQVYPDDHPFLAITYNNIGAFHISTGDFQAARTMLEKALIVLKKRGREKHPNTAKTMINLAQVVAKLGDHDEAIRQMDEALVILRHHLSDDHPAIGKAMHNLAFLHKETGNMKSGIALLHQAKSIFENRLGGEHPLVAKCHHSISVFLAEAGRLKEAVAEMKQCLKLRQNPNSSSDITLAQTHYDLAAILFMAGQIDETITHCDSAAQIWSTTDNKMTQAKALLLALHANLLHGQSELQNTRDLIHDIETLFDDIEDGDPWSVSYFAYLKSISDNGGGNADVLCEQLIPVEDSAPLLRRFIAEKCNDAGESIAD